MSHSRDSHTLPISIFCPVEFSSSLSLFLHIPLIEPRPMSLLAYSFELLYFIPPFYYYMCTFGCTYLSLFPPGDCTVLPRRAAKCIFFGCGAMDKGNHFYDPSTCLRISWHVTLNHSLFLLHPSLLTAPFVPSSSDSEVGLGYECRGYNRN